MKHSSKILAVPAFATAALLFTPSVFAHTFGAHSAGFGDGLAHPFLGLDHLLAMLAVGIWAACLGGSALWRVPTVFLLAMGAGAWLAGPALSMAGLEAGIAASVLALGLLIAFAPRLAGWLSFALVAFFALFHGAAHGLEMPEASSPLGYGLGFLLATASLHGMGVLLGLALGRFRVASLTAGSAIAVTGLLLLAV